MKKNSWIEKLWRKIFYRFLYRTISKIYWRTILGRDYRELMPKLLCVLDLTRDQSNIGEESPAIVRLRDILYLLLVRGIARHNETCLRGKLVDLETLERTVS
jgi:hypothetical protein